MSAGLHVESVYSEDVFVAVQPNTNLTLMVQITGSFWKGLDIIYIRSV